MVWGIMSHRYPKMAHVQLRIYFNYNLPKAINFALNISFGNSRTWFERKYTGKTMNLNLQPID
jgi:hypothetical protein